MALIGLTGGTGSGKSAAARRFESLGMAVIDADKVGHRVIEPGGPAYDAVCTAFGHEILVDGVIDRDRLGAIVFADATKRATLNAIVHPVIRNEIAAECAARFSEGHRHVIIDAALLAENGTRDPWLDSLILVLCPTEERVRRLVAYRGIDEAEARRRIDAQTLPESKRGAADWIIDNHGTLEALHAQVDRIAGEIQHDEG